MESYETLSEAIHALKKQGYTIDFNLNQNCIVCTEGKYSLLHDEFHIDKLFRFDHLEDPGDQSVLYAISSDTQGVKGLLVNGYGIYSEGTANEIIRKLSTQ